MHWFASVICGLLTWSVPDSSSALLPQAKTKGACSAQASIKEVDRGEGGDLHFYEFAACMRGSCIFEHAVHRVRRRLHYCWPLAASSTPRLYARCLGSTYAAVDQLVPAGRAYSWSGNSFIAVVVVSIHTYDWRVLLTRWTWLCTVLCLQPFVLCHALWESLYAWYWIYLCWYTCSRSRHVGLIVENRCSHPGNIKRRTLSPEERYRRVS
jgi:hypothetical protein